MKAVHVDNGERRDARLEHGTYCTARMADADPQAKVVKCGAVKLPALPCLSASLALET
jgi:hypothetical protein